MKWTKTSLSSTFMQCDVKAPGLYSLSTVVFDFLGTGTRQKVFQTLKVPFSLSRLRLRLKKCCSSQQSWPMQAFRTLELMPSGPAALVRLSLSNCLLTWQLETNRQRWDGGGVGVVLSCVRGVRGESVFLSAGGED